NYGEGDPLCHAFSIGQLLLKKDPSSRDADGATCGIFIISDQSSLKSTIIEHQYDPKLEEAEYDLLLEYDVSEKTETLVSNSNLQDLTSKFTKIDNSHLDNKKEARIIICSNILSFAIDCCDNPGLIPTNISTQKNTNNIICRTLEKVLERQKLQNDSIVLLCILAKFLENLSWPRQMDLIEKINGENLIILVTRMDQINVSKISQEIKNSEPFSCNSWNVLKFIRSKIEQQAHPHHFPKGVQFHYTASSSENWNILLEYRWNAFEKSERKNNETMCNILCNKDE
ncbi:43656_t:CDS:2, partial [Gigaspora margarita]